MQVLPVKMQEAKDKGQAFFLEIYLVELRTQKLWLVAADEDIDWDGHHFTAVPVKRGTITKSMDNIVSEVDLEVGDCTDELLDYVMSGFDFRGCRVTIGRILYPDSLQDNTWSWVFMGAIDNPTFSNGVFKCKVSCEFPKIDVPSRMFYLACNSEFGDAICKQNKCTTTLTVVSSGGCGINVGRTYPSNYWKYGTATIDGESRNIINSSGNNITVNANFLQPIDGRVIKLERGCNHTFEWCTKVYHNARNYSGFPAVPWESEYR